ncbi:hypothetical protein ES689_08640 [Frigoribacterium sp. ACAM 257]|uniref:hypothetical protein n=1 Tax=Frigoribacterium sp. ACAM 257 TaxID=2508998 RepID=UPI0011B9A02A|nr:hypothetical protein [Frigoribacterium sp. ACAM 257]TWX38672.1 hypothetical protein ES689_08640 [Frigoribacterium sp. ACAM 257]
MTRPWAALPPESQRDPRTWVRFLAAAALVVLGHRLALPQGLFLGHVVALVLLPVWWGSMRLRRGGVPFLALGAGAAVAGIWLGAANDGDHAVSSGTAVPMTVTLVGALVSVGLFAWACDVLGANRAVLWYGLGLALAVSPSTTLFASNPWKFGFAIPVTVIALALAHRLGRRWELATLAVLTVVAALNDFRSAFGLLLLATLLLFAQIALSRSQRRVSPTGIVVGLAALVAIVFQLGQALIIDGYLGTDTQARSLEQLRSSGSLILGGRPELAATFALMREHPWGFGAGSVPAPFDIQVAKQGMSSIGYQPDNGYVERFMFGGAFELHSVFGNLWAQSGLFGLALVALVLGLLVTGVVKRLADHTASGILLYAAAQSAWNVFFAPFLTSVPMLVLALALVLVPTQPRPVPDELSVATPRRPSSRLTSARTR